MDPREVIAQILAEREMAQQLGIQHGENSLRLPPVPQSQSPLSFRRGQVTLNLMQKPDQSFYGYVRPKLNSSSLGVKDVGLVYKRTF